MANFLDKNGLLYLWTQIKAKLSDKVDKVDGKGLSTNDFTTAEKTKLAGIADNANNYSHPTYTAQANGLYKVTVDGTGHVSEVTNITAADITALGIPAEDTNTTYTLTKSGNTITLTGSDGSTLSVTDSDTTYEEATTSKAGLMSAADKAKMDGIEANADVNIIESVKVNGTALTVSAKAVDITVPTTVASLSDASNYALKTDIANVYKYKGSVAAVSNLPASGNTVGDVYNVEADGMNYGWDGEKWDALGMSFEITAITNDEIDEILAN